MQNISANLSNDSSQRASTEAELESWLSVEQVDDNFNSVGQKQYIDESRQHKFWSNNLDFEQSGSNEFDRSIRTCIFSDNSNEGKTSTGQQKSSSGAGSYSTLDE
ncbi:hypothetical protein D915_003134 [Fasciola hepatica]|uniref:Uncharacterized protein n=1 Tax=Fasciola hepatica TaxID=6192 RepID=A0A4E0RGN2_FASHE|nr:hypothetical protein D915_003134 [Fasciola hepatica]